MSSLALSDSFEYLCYECNAIRNLFILTARESTLVVRIWRLETSDSVNESRFPRCKSCYSSVNKNTERLLQLTSVVDETALFILIFS